MGRAARKRPRSAGIIVNLFLILVIAALYAFTSGNDAVHTMAALYAGPVYRGSSNDSVALEIAVSWDASAVEDMLDILKERGVKVTFAVTGEYAALQPGLVARMVSDGHELATMGEDIDFDGSASAVTRDVEASLGSIFDACGKSPALYYSGAREIGPSSRAARKLGLTHVLCTLDLRCAAGSADEIIERGLNEPIIGSIILLQPTRAALKALPGLLEGFALKGIKAVPVSEVLGRG